MKNYGLALRMILVIGLFGFLTGFQVNAQKLYVRAIGNYNIGVKSQKNRFVASETLPIDDSLHWFGKYSSTSFSLGNGKTFGGSVGISLGKKIDFDLSVLRSNTSSDKLKLETNWDLGHTVNIRIIDKHQYKAQSTVFAPALHFKQPVYFSYFYSRFGLLFSQISVTSYYNYDLYNNMPGYLLHEYFETVEEFSKVNSVGFTAGLGFEIYLLENLFLFFDFSFNYLKFVPETSRLTKYQFMGEDWLDDININQKEFEYVDEYTTQGHENPDEPTKQLKYFLPLDNIAIQFGLKYSFADLSGKSSRLFE
jgi:hypothetical protein